MQVVLLVGNVTVIVNGSFLILALHLLYLEEVLTSGFRVSSFKKAMSAFVAKFVSVFCIEVALIDHLKPFERFLVLLLLIVEGGQFEVCMKLPGRIGMLEHEFLELILGVFMEKIEGAYPVVVFGVDAQGLLWIFLQRNELLEFFFRSYIFFVIE